MHSGNNHWLYLTSECKLYPEITAAMIWACDCDLTVNPWHHRVPAVTPLWHHSDPVVTPRWPPRNITVRWIKSFCLSESGHSHSDLRSNHLSSCGRRWGAWSGALWSNILSAFPPLAASVGTSFSSTCDLHTWPVSSPLPHPLWSHSDESCDHTLASGGGESRDSQVSSTATHMLGVCGSMRERELWHFDLLHCDQFGACCCHGDDEKKEPWFSFTCISCCF